MDFWELVPRSDLPEDDNPWEPWYDKCFHMVVRADSELQARQVASHSGGEEDYSWRKPKPPSVWADSKYSICRMLSVGGEPEVIITNIHEA